MTIEMVGSSSSSHACALMRERIADGFGGRGSDGMDTECRMMRGQRMAGKHGRRGRWGEALPKPGNDPSADW